MQNSTQHTTETANFDAFVSSPFAAKALQIANFQKLEKAKENDDNKSISRGLNIAKIISAGYEFLRTNEAKKAAKENGISLKPAALAMQIYEMPSSTFYKYLKGNENAERVSEFLEYAENMRQSGKKLRSVGFDAFTDWCAKKPTTAAADKPTDQKISVKFADKTAVFNLTTSEAKNALSLSELETVIRQLFNERKALRKLATAAAEKKETLKTAAEKAAAAAKKAAILKAGKKKTTQPDSVQALNDMQTA